jgi:uncharacterized protein (TIGR02246 family)
MKLRRMPVLIGSAFVLVLVASAAALSLRSSTDTFAGARTTQSSRTTSDDIAKLRAEWVKDLHTKQLDQIAALYTEDAEFLHATGTRVSGRAAIRELCKSIMDTMTSDLTLHTATSERSGDLAYDSGDYSETLTAVSDGKKSQYSGTYVMIFRRQANGKWLITEQVWTDASPCAH